MGDGQRGRGARGETDARRTQGQTDSPQSINGLSGLGVYKMRIGRRDDREAEQAAVSPGNLSHRYSARRDGIAALRRSALRARRDETTDGRDCVPRRSVALPANRLGCVDFDDEARPERRRPMVST